MKYVFVLMFFIVSNGFGFAQLNDYKPYKKYNIYYPGIYHYSKQRGTPYNQYFDNLSWGPYGGYQLEYEQYENILFFKGERNFIMDRINAQNIYTEMDKIDSIVFSNYNEITIKGSHAVKGDDYFNNRRNLEWVNTISEEIIITFYNPSRSLRHNMFMKINVDEKIGQEIPKNELEGRSESFFDPVASENNKYFLFNFFGTNIVFDFTQFKHDYDYIKISAIYNTVFDEYYIFVDFYKGDH